MHETQPRGFLIGLCIIFIPLSFIFQSYIEPLIVMVAIPFGLIFATVLVALLVPSLYSILAWLGWSQKIEKAG